jgi:hypothetical protein
MPYWLAAARRELARYANLEAIAHAQRGELSFARGRLVGHFGRHDLKHGLLKSERESQVSGSVRRRPYGDVTQKSFRQTRDRQLQSCPDL